MGLPSAEMHHVNRILMGRPSRVSSAKNVPTPPLKLPTTGVSRARGNARPATISTTCGPANRTSGSRQPGSCLRAGRSGCLRRFRSPHRLAGRRQAVERIPVGTAGEPRFQAPMMNAPVADHEVEIRRCERIQRKRHGTPGAKVRGENEGDNGNEPAAIERVLARFWALGLWPQQGLVALPVGVGHE